MIVRDQTIMSLKLRKKLKELERQARCISFGLMLDEVNDRIQTPKLKRVRK
jgi:hypothetical protein